MSIQSGKKEYTTVYDNEMSSDTTLLSDGEDAERFVSRQKRSQRGKMALKLLYIIIAIQSVMLLGFVYSAVTQSYRPQATEPEEAQHRPLPGGEIYGLVPEFNTELKLVKNQMDMYTTDFTSEAQSLKIRQRWSDLMPRGNGVIHVEPNSDHKLLQHSFVSESSNGTSVQLVSWVHQLHCLYALMDAYDAVVQFGSDGAEGEVLKGHKQVHSSHCFDYLRQTILCNMDSALEGAREPGGKGTDGWDAYHTCRNYDEVKAWTESLRMSDDQWILLPGDSRIGNGGRYPDPHSGHT